MISKMKNILDMINETLNTVEAKIKNSYRYYSKGNKNDRKILK
jgi:hypothetical protein